MIIKSPGPVPQDAIDYFNAKGYKPAFSWLDVWREEHASVFTVAKAMQLDVLTTIRESLDSALTEGKTFRQFQQELEPTLQRLGWWGRQEVIDPLTGERIEAELGTPRRLRIMYDANLRAARAAGQWERIQRSKDQFPYLLYQIGPSLEHRLQHLAWNGLLLPVDDPFWQRAMPPNGWGCKCRVRAVTQREYDNLRSNGIPSRDPNNPGMIAVKTQSPGFQMVDFVNPRTGATARVPEGIDPGWDYNPGQAGRASSLDSNLAESAKASGLSAGLIDAAMRLTATELPAVEGLVAGHFTADYIQALYAALLQSLPNDIVSSWQIDMRAKYRLSESDTIRPSAQDIADLIRRTENL